MIIRKFQIETDFPRLEAYLQAQYLLHNNTVSWLPAKLHDIVYRVGAFEEDNGDERSADYFFLWEEDGKIVGCILPDGENVYFSLADGYAHLFPDMLSYSEEHCLPLFHKADDGSVKFWVAVSDRLGYMQEHLKKSGYARYADNEYDNCVNPAEISVSVTLPDGFRLLYGEDFPDEEKKWDAHHLGFHPDDEGIAHENSMNPYNARKQSSLYPDSFECMVAAGDELCSYCFTYVDKKTGTAYIEPVSTREKYRHKGFGTAMMHGVILRCKDAGIRKCYVNSFGWRKEFYNAAGFTTEDSTGFWHKVLNT